MTGARARALVQIVDVLRDERDPPGPRLHQPRERVMGRVRDRGQRVAPAGVVEGAHPVGIPGEGLGGRHVLEPVLRPETPGIAEGAEPAFRRDAGPCQNDDALHPASAQVVKAELRPRPFGRTVSRV